MSLIGTKLLQIYKKIEKQHEQFIREVQMAE